MTGRNKDKARRNGCRNASRPGTPRAKQALPEIRQTGGGEPKRAEERGGRKEARNQRAADQRPRGCPSSRQRAPAGSAPRAARPRAPGHEGAPGAWRGTWTRGQSCSGDGPCLGSGARQPYLGCGRGVPCGLARADAPGRHRNAPRQAGAAAARQCETPAQPPPASGWRSVNRCSTGAREQSGWNPPGSQNLRSRCDGWGLLGENFASFQFSLSSPVARITVGHAFGL